LGLALVRLHRDVLDEATLAATTGCAAIAWVNPHADRPGYASSACGMRAALPYVTALTSLDDVAALTNLGRRVRVDAVA
jgi:uncharacterized protein with von Willebrand factor type A (vWA) domain